MERLNYYDKEITLDRQALKQAYEIINADEEMVEKIPNKLRWIISDNMDKSYDFDVFDVDEASELKEDTRKILTFLYTNYLSTEEERKVLKQLEKLQYEKKHSKEQKQQVQPRYTSEINYSHHNEINYSHNNQAINIPSIQEQKEVNLVEKKESVIQRIINFFKKLFK